MGISNRERIIVGIATVIFFAAFSSVAYLDRPHGTAGDEIAQEDFTVSIERNSGHVAIPDFPDDLIIFGAEQDVSLDFSIANHDEDNDIDTVYITIPGSNMINATTEWYDPLFEHEWEFSSPSTGIAKVQARDDLPGRNFGGSAMYDVAGNIDDALDHSGSLDINEGITITLEFKTPFLQGIKVGNDAIHLEVADEKTETGTTDRYSIEPFPYPYLVIDTDYEFILYEVEGADLDIKIDGHFAFGTGTRASGFQSSQDGYKYISNEGKVIAVINAPTNGEIVDPVLITENDIGGPFTINMIQYKTGIIDPDQPTSGWLTTIASQIGYTGNLPTNIGERISLDMDGDGLFTDNDDDIDGDGVPNDEDTSPYDSGIANHHPSIVLITPSETSISKDKILRIDLETADEDGDILQYSWSVSPEVGWTATVEDVEIDLTDFDPGTYTFKVVITDGSGGEDEASTSVEIIKADETNGVLFWVYIIAIMILLVLVVIIGLLFLVKRKKPEEIDIEQAPLIDSNLDPKTEGKEQQDRTHEESVPYYDTSIQEAETSMEPLVTPTYEPVSDIEEEYPRIDESQDLENLITEINEGEDELGDTCPDCGADLGEFDTECPNCGLKFEVMIECPVCGFEMDQNLERCPKCGTYFEKT